MNTNNVYESCKYSCKHFMNIATEKRKEREKREREREREKEREMLAVILQDNFNLWREGRYYFLITRD